MDFLRRHRVLRRLLYGGVILGLLPVLGILGLALRYDLELDSWIESIFYEPAEFTIDPALLTRAAYADAVFAGEIENREVLEISGLAASRRRAGVLWGLNDSLNEPRLYAIGTDGRDLGAVDVEVPNIDWEDLAAFRWQGRPYLVIADIGDNQSWRPFVQLHFFLEPEVPDEGLPEGLVLTPAWSQRIRYEQGPRDCESIAIDEPGQQILLLDKRHAPANLYMLPLAPGETTPDDPSATRVARKIAILATLPQPTEREKEEADNGGDDLSRPTAMDIAPDGSAAVLLTKRHGYLYARAPGQSWREAFEARPERIPIPPLRVAESIAFGREGRTLWLSSEHRPTPLFRFDALDQ